MSGFLYYVPLPPDQATPDELSSRGLGATLKDVLGKWRPNANVCAWQLHGSGPDGAIGTVIYPLPMSGDIPRTPGYKPAQQEWVDCGDYWLGYDTEQRPTPTDLQRPQFVDGYEVELGDGQVWTVPIIRRYGRRMNLPRTYGRSGGEWTEQVLPEYGDIWEKSAKWWDLCCGNGTLSEAEALDACCEILAVNYRIGPDEVSHLKLLTSENIVTVFKNACDFPWWEEMLKDPKKKAQLESVALDMENSLHGPEDSPPTTRPAERN